MQAGNEERRPVGAFPWNSMAEWTGLEPATSGVTGQHSNRLNYHSAEPRMVQPAVAARNIEMVGAEGFEPPTLSV